jgi:hypothetical protein
MIQFALDKVAIKYVSKIRNAKASTETYDQRALKHQ